MIAMSQSVGRIDLDMGINYGQFQKELNGISSKATGLVGGSFKKLGGIIAAAFATKGLIDFGREAINLASDLSEVQNVVDVTFGNMSSYVDDFAQKALTQFGLSELSAKRYTSVLGAIMKSSGLASSQIAEMSTTLAGLAGDFASFYNLRPDEAFEKIRSAVTGETEPLLALGIDMRATALDAYALSQGINKSVSSMSTAEQTLLRYNYLLDRSRDAQGDFARTSNSWANQTRLLSEQWKIFMGTMGQGFINILTPVVRALNILVQKIQIAAKYFVAFTELIFGKSGAATSASNAISSIGASADTTSDSMGGMGKATEKVGKSAKKAGKDIKGTVSNFDMLNIIGIKAAEALDDAAGGLDDLGGGGIGDVSLGEITEPDVTKLDPLANKLDELKEKAGLFGNALKEMFGPSVATAMAMVLPQLDAWKRTFQETFEQLMPLAQPFTEWLRTGLVDAINASIVTLGLSFATLLDVTRHAFEGMREVAMPIIEWFVKEGLPAITDWFVDDLNPLIQQAVTTFGEILKGLIDTTVMVLSDLRDAIMPIIDWIVKEGLELVTDFVSDAIRLFKTLFDSAKEIFDTLWEEGIKPGLDLVSKMIVDTLDIIKKTWDKWGDDITEGLQGVIESIKGIFMNLWDKILEPIWTSLLENLTFLWDKHLKGLVEELGDFIGKLVDGATEIFNKFITPIVNWIIDKFGPAFSQGFKFVLDVTASFLGAIIDFTKGILKALGGIIDFITGVFTGDWKKAWEGVKTVFKGIFDAFGGIIKGAMNIVISVINNAIRAINRIKIDVPDWVQDITGIGGSFGFNIKEIPKLARGGIVSGPTLAMVGDNKNANVDPEVVTPVSKLSDMLAQSNQAVIEVLLMLLDAIENLDLSLDIDGEKLTRVMRSRLQAEDGRVGRNAITVGGVPIR